jgi:hypothetical protein
VKEPDRPLCDLADVTGLAWSPDGAWIALQVAPHGGERTEVHLADPATGEVRDLAPGAAAATLGAWAPTGRVVGLTVFPQGSGDGQACLVDVRDGTSTVLAAGPAARVCAVSGDGRRAVVRLGRRGARHLELVDLRTGRRTELIPGGEALVADARFGVTGRQLYVHTDAGTGAARAAGRHVARLVGGVDGVPDRRARRPRPRRRRPRPGGRPGRAGVERRRAQRDRAARPALGARRAVARGAGRGRHPGWRSPAPATAC